MAENHLFIFGLGYTGKRAALAFQRRGYRVSGTVRSEEQALEVKATGIVDQVFLFDQLHDDALQNVTHILSTIAPNREQDDPVFSTHRSLLQTAKAKWIGYLSTIAVYGDTDGKVVDETAPLLTNLQRGKLRINAEIQWMTLNAQIFRLPGIYGPKRGPLSKCKAQTAKRIEIRGKVFNRIHVDDIVNTLLVSARINGGKCSNIYNVCDDLPSPNERVIQFACELLKMEVPPLQSWEQASETMSSMAKSFYAENKAVSNEKLKAELKVVLLYPTYKEGLRAQMIQEQQEETIRLDKSQACVLINTGSLSAAPFLDLRTLCDHMAVSWYLGSCSHVLPASARHSHKIPSSELHGEPADTIQSCITRLMEKGARSFTLLPLFFGPSTTVSEFIPAQVSELSVQVKIADVLVSKDDAAIAGMLHDKICRWDYEKSAAIVVVDHGTPTKAVHEAREIVGSQLRHLMGSKVNVVTASMERKPAAEYDFNEPLLEDVLKTFPPKSTVIVSLLFLSNGRHAGPDGDIEKIIQQAKEITVHLTGCIGTPPALSQLLVDRYNQN